MLFSQVQVLPQGTVLAPFLFTLYTSDWWSHSSKCPLVKFADDTALIGLISKDDDSAFLSQVDSFVNHCDANYLKLNVSKTKEMVIDFRQTSPDPQLVDTKFGTHIRIDMGIILTQKHLTHPIPRGVPGRILGGHKFKSPGNVMNCPEHQYFV